MIETSEGDRGSSQGIDLQRPQDNAFDEGQPSDDDSMDDRKDVRKAVVARHKQRSKKSEGDTEHAVTQHTVFNTKSEARSHRIKVDSDRMGRQGPGFFRRNLNFGDYKRSPGEREAMSDLERAKKRFTLTTFGRSSTTEQTDIDSPTSCKQYSIPPPEDDGVSLLYGIQAFFSMKFVDLIFWKFKTGFLNVMVVFLMTYLFFVNVFMLIIYGVVTRAYGKGVECIDGWDYLGNDGGHSLNWEISFSLSWTTFSTVGFGTVSPDVLAGCYGLRYACAIEAFIGVLYAGFCGAIFFAKFSRLIGRAQVIFSSTILIQYGIAARGQQDESLNARAAPRNPKQVKNPFPVLEFRLVNTRANEKGCEILDATISCLACVNEGSVPKRPSHHSDALHDSSHGVSNLVRKISSREAWDEKPAGKEAMKWDEKPAEKAFVFDDTSGVNEKISLLRQKYHNLNIQTRHHPYFRRVWYLRHQLDAASPLIKPDVRRRIQECGHWPPDLNNHASVRGSLVEFNDIIVTLNGTSNLNASDVFAQHKYQFRDLHVGWQFAGMLYFGRERSFGLIKKGKEKMKVDISLIHDILPQAGGRNEPIDIGLKPE